MGKQHRTAAWFLAAGVLAACGPKPQEGRPGRAQDVGDPPEPGDSGPSSTDTGVPEVTPAPCHTARFGAVGVSLALPTGWTDADFQHLDGQEAEGMAWRWVRVEGLPALLVMRGTFDEGGGASPPDKASALNWTLYRVTATALSAAETWSVPADVDAALLVEGGVDAEGSLGAQPFHVPLAAVPRRAWLTDLDGDGTTDLVRFVPMGEGPGRVGVWTIYRGTATGLGDPEPWRLPRDLSALLDARADLAPDDGTAWELRDLDGDGRDDLVVTHLPDDPVIGPKAWQVHTNTGRGFGVGERWYLPRGMRAGTTAGPRDWVLADTDGDRRPDLVAVPALGSGEGGPRAEEVPTAAALDAWHVHRNSGRGFAAHATILGLPTDLPVNARASVHGTTTDDYAWSYVDVNGDSAHDIVVTRDYRAAADGTTPDPTAPIVGTTVWRVYPALTDAALVAAKGGPLFGEAIDFELPTGFPEGRFEDPALALEAEPAWNVVDLDGDGARDLVITAWRRGPESGIGTTSWRVHAGECATRTTMP